MYTMQRIQYFISRFFILGCVMFFTVYNVAKKNWAVIIPCLLLYTATYWLFGEFLAFCVLVCIAIVIIYFVQDNLLYHPNLPPQSRFIISLPSIFGLPYEDVYILTPDNIRLHLFVITQPIVQSQSKVPTLLYLHGNAGNIGHRLHNAAELYQNLKCNIVMLEYRGYGLSKGKPYESGLYKDGRAALDYISSRKDLNSNEIIVFGRSLGGAVGIDLAIDIRYESKISCLIIENTFTNIPEMANVLIGWRVLRKLPQFCFKNKFLSSEKINKLKVPILLISGLADTLVPPRMMKDLHQLCSSAHKKLVEFRNGSHNETWNCNGYYNSIEDFLQEINQSKKKPLLEYNDSISVTNALMQLNN